MSPREGEKKPAGKGEIKKEKHNRGIVQGETQQKSRIDSECNNMLGIKLSHRSNGAAAAAAPVQSPSVLWMMWEFTWMVVEKKGVSGSWWK